MTVVLLHILAGLVTAGASFFMWAAIHELCHYAMLKEVKYVKFHLYPHMNGDQFFWARISYRAANPSDEELAWISIAPRWADIIGVALTVLTAWTLQGSWLLLVPILFGGSLIDLAVGSLGINEESDLQRAARGWKINPWILRISGWVIVLGAGAASLAGVAIGVLENT